MVAGLIRIGEVAKRIMDGEADRGVAHATSGPCLQQNLVCVLEGEDLMAKQPVAVVGDRPDQAPGDPRRRVDGRPRPRGRVARARPTPR